MNAHGSLFKTAATLSPEADQISLISGSCEAESTLMLSATFAIASTSSGSSQGAAFATWAIECGFSPRSVERAQSKGRGIGRRYRMVRSDRRDFIADRRSESSIVAMGGKLGI